MLNRNIQMKKKNNGIWENLFPLTLNENVFNTDGLSLNDQLENLNTMIDDKFTDQDNMINDKFNDQDNQINEFKIQTNKRLDDFKILNALDFELVGDGVTDDSESLKNALQEASDKNASLYIPNGTYAINQVTIDTPIILGNNVTFKFNGEIGGTLLSFTINNLHVPFIQLDGDNKACTLMRVFGNNNNFGTISLKNIYLTNDSPNHCFGMLISGDNNYFDYIDGQNFINVEYRNESFPQAVAIEGFDNVFNTITLKNVASGLITGDKNGNETLTKVNNLYIEDASDNGVYNLSNSSLHVNNIFYYGNEEPAVFLGNDIFIDNFRIKGGGSRIGFQNVDNVRINKIHLEVDKDGNGLNAIFRTRAGNVTTGSISIGEISGELVSHIPGCQLLMLDQGIVKYLTIGKMDVVHSYKGEKGDLSRWAYFDAVQQFKIGDISIKIVDLDNTFTSNDRFEMVFPYVIKQSYLNSLRVDIVNGDGAEYSPATFRGSRLKQKLIRVKDVTFQTNIGPYARERKYGEVNTISQIPDVGYWHHGELYYNAYPTSENASGWICIESGSPGVWKEI